MNEEVEPETQMRDGFLFIGFLYADKINVDE